jgi:hypothetical protein
MVAQKWDQGILHGAFAPLKVEPQRQSFVFEADLIFQIGEGAVGFSGVSRHFRRANCVYYKSLVKKGKWLLVWPVELG